MRPILDTSLWIGTTRDARSFTQLFDQGVEALIDLAWEERPEPPPRELIWLRIPLLDGAGNPPLQLRLAVHAVMESLADQRPTLVACSGGMSRSPAIVAAAIAAMKGETADEWLVRVVEGAPHDVAPLLWRDVKQAIVPKAPGRPGLGYPTKVSEVSS
jgi:hypothetical protein